MKKLFTTLFFFATVSCCIYSQDLTNNFIQDENGLIYWQKIIESQLTSKQIKGLINESGYFINITDAEDKILCDLKPYKANYQAYGYSNMKAPFYISRSLVGGNVIFEFKEDKYRVTIKNIVFTQNIEDTFSKQGEVETFESWVLNKSQKIKPAFFTDGSDILNKDFIIKTTFITEKENNW